MAPIVHTGAFEATLTETDPSLLRTSRCISCGSPMFAGAEQCVECGTLQDWRRKILVWRDVFSTVPIFIGVIGAVISVFKFAPSSNIEVLDGKCMTDRATFTVSNTGTRAGLLRLDGIFDGAGLVTTARFANDAAAGTIMFVKMEAVAKVEVLYDQAGGLGLREIRVATGESLGWMWRHTLRC